MRGAYRATFPSVGNVDWRLSQWVLPTKISEFFGMWKAPFVFISSTANIFPYLKKAFFSLLEKGNFILIGYTPSLSIKIFEVIYKN